MANEPVVTRINFPFADLQMWSEFVVGLRRTNRFTLQDRSAKFVDAIIRYARTHKEVTLPKDTCLFRARISEEIERQQSLSLDDMGAPPPEFAGHGRLNPKGIPYLYLASNELTAISEVRPWVGCNLTVAEFTLNRDCRLINFSQKYMVSVPEGEEFEGAEITWQQVISWMFSHPFDPRDDTAYVPTQFLAERIKGAGFEGIVYDSALHDDGYNVALFDPGNADGVRRQSARVTKLDVEADLRSLNE